MIMHVLSTVWFKNWSRAHMEDLHTKGPFIGHVEMQCNFQYLYLRQTMARAMGRWKGAAVLALALVLDLANHFFL